MAGGREQRALSEEQGDVAGVYGVTVAKPAPGESEPFIPPWEECLDDVTLPPGGGGHKASAIPTPCDPKYLTEQGRDLRLDLLRGYFVFAMIVDHVRGASPLYLITGGNRFYASAAEGFILVSGLVTGLVYRKLIERLGLGAGLMKIMARALTLYLLTVGLTLFFLPLSELLYLPWAQGIDLTNPLALVISVMTLHRTYYLVDVMLLYTVLFLARRWSLCCSIAARGGSSWPAPSDCGRSFSFTRNMRRCRGRSPATTSSISRPGSSCSSSAY